MKIIRLTDSSKLKEIEDQLVALLTPLPPEFVNAGLDWYEIADGEFLPGKFGRHLKFINPSSHRTLGISMIEKGVSDVMICRPRNEPADYHCFTADDYLTDMNREKERAELTSKMNHPTEYLALIRKLIKDDWTEILQGTKWVEVLDSLYKR